MSSQRLCVDGWEVFENADGKFVTFPKFSLNDWKDGGVPAGNCAGYARRVSNSFFGRHYDAPEGYREAWNLPFWYESIPVVGPERFETLRDLYASELLVPGDLVMFHNSQSTLNGKQKDRAQNPVRYTHATCFLGEDTENYLQFGHQVINDRTIDCEREMRKRGMSPRLIVKDVLRT